MCNTTDMCIYCFSNGLLLDIIWGYDDMMMNIDNFESYCALFYYLEDATCMESKDRIQVKLTLTQCFSKIEYGD